MCKYDPSQPILYTDIPKCSESSVVRLLRLWFDGGYHKLNQDETQNIILPRVETKDEAGNWLPNVKCIHGHFNHGRGYGLPYFYPEVNQYFTVLRDPFDVTVSMYFYAKRRSREGRFWLRGQPVDLRQQFPTIESYLNTYPYWLFDHIPQNITLDNYKQKLNEKFVYLGVFEDLQTTIDNLGKIFGKKSAQLPFINVSEYDELVPEHLRERFYHDYPLLKRIYDFAVEHYETVETD